jgi:hypothetical protein
MKKLILSVLVAALLLTLFYLCLYVARNRCMQNDGFALLFAIAWIIGAMASVGGRVPDPILTVVVNASLFVLFLAPVYLLASCVELLHAEYLKRRRK